jgi:hypothetical protein
MASYIFKKRANSKRSITTQNAKRRSYDYIIGHNVFKKVVDLSKLGRRVDGCTGNNKLKVNKTLSSTCPIDTTLAVLDEPRLHKLGM